MSTLKEPVIQLNEFSPPDAENYDDSSERENKAMDNLLLRKYTKLCEIAKMDAWHDHHTISDLLKEEINQFVLRHLPVRGDKNVAFNCYESSGSSSSGSSASPGSAGGDGQPSSEDIFIYRMFLKKSGVAIRMSVSDLRVMGRATQGVKLVKIKEEGAIAAVAKVMKDQDEADKINQEETKEE